MKLQPTIKTVFRRSATDIRRQWRNTTDRRAESLFSTCCRFSSSLLILVGCNEIPDTNIQTHLALNTAVVSSVKTSVSTDARSVALLPPSVLSRATNALRFATGIASGKASIVSDKISISRLQTRA